MSNFEKTDVPLAVLDDEADLDVGLPPTSGFQNKLIYHRDRVSNFKSSLVSPPKSLFAQPDRANNNNNNPIRSNSFTASILDSTTLDVDDENVSTISSAELETFSETLTGSLENLVGQFDEKITHCLKNFSEKTDSMAPVQIRTQEEIMSESQIWMTLTGNYGNMLPLDWSKTNSQNANFFPIRLRSKRSGESVDSCVDLPDDEELAQALDLDKLMSPPQSVRDSPPQTADQVIEEIDEIMQQSCDSEFTASSDFTMDSTESLYSPMKPIFHFDSNYSSKLGPRVKSIVSFASSVDELKHLSRKKLILYRAELESLIQIYNETLVQELALRDELEYEKELKNRFISLMSSIQSKKRKYHLENKKRNKNSLFSGLGNGARVPQYLTTVVPYEIGGLTNFVLEALIKILYAINEDNPNVPSMLTDYILNVLCPTTTTTEKLPKKIKT